MDKREWNARHKVRRTMLGTRWRFLDVSESLGMVACEYDTRREATAARDLAFRIYQMLNASAAAKEAALEKATPLGGGL